MSVLTEYKQLPSGFWVRNDGSGPYFVDVETDTATAAGSTSGQGGTVTNTQGSLTSNNVILGNGGDDVKRVAGIDTDGVSKLKLGVAGSSVGGVELRNGTSGSVTIQPVTGALGAVTLQAPAVDGTLATTANIADAVSGLKWKLPCRVATTVAGTLASSFENGDTVDGVVLATNDRILIKDQAAGAENGVYTVSASGAPTRATDSNTGDLILNASVLITAGTTNANRQYTCNTVAPITINVTALVFVQINASGGSIATDPIWQAEGDLVYGTGVSTAARLAKGSALQALRRNAANNAFEYYSPAASGATDATAAEILALTTGDEGVIYHATSSSGDVYEDGYYVWNEYLGELQQLVAVTPAEAVAISDGYQGSKTVAAMLAMTAVEGMTCSVSDLGNMISFWRYNGTYWVPFGGRQQIFSLLADTYNATADGTERIITGCQVAIPAGLLPYDGAGLETRWSVEKQNGVAESPTVTLRCGSAGTIADAALLGAFTATAGSTRSIGAQPSAARTAATGLRLKGIGNITTSAYRYAGTVNQARPAAIVVGNWGSATNYVSLSSQRTTPFAEYLAVDTFDVWLTGR